MTTTTESVDVELRVIRQGAVRVNAAHICRRAPGIVCIYVDLHSKYATQPMVISGDEDPPQLYFAAGADTLHLDESKPRDIETAIELPEYVGWDVFAVDGPRRYTLALVLLKKAPQT